jgi:hypothetical protein
MNCSEGSAAVTGNPAMHICRRPLRESSKGFLRKTTWQNRDLGGRTSHFLGGSICGNARYFLGNPAIRLTPGIRIVEHRGYRLVFLSGGLVYELWNQKKTLGSSVALVQKSA